MPASNDFLPPDYEVPKTSGKFLKFKIGENRIRILADKPLMGWVAWIDGGDKRVPSRRPANTFAPHEYDDKGKPKHFWAMPVWDYGDNRIKVLEITQQTIQSDIKALAGNKKWGHPTGYDITITAVGEGMDREYTTMPDPKEPLSVEIKKAWAEIHTTFDIARLMDNGDPFGDEQTVAKAKSAPVDADIPF